MWTDKGSRKPLCLQGTGDGWTEENGFWESLGVLFLSRDPLPWSLECPGACDEEETPSKGTNACCPFCHPPPASSKRMWKACKSVSSISPRGYKNTRGSWRLRGHWLCSSLDGVRREANDQAHWPTLTFAERSPRPSPQQLGPREALHWACCHQWPLSLTWITSPSAVLSSEDVLVFSWKKPGSPKDTSCSNPAGLYLCVTRFPVFPPGVMAILSLQQIHCNWTS